MNNIKKSIWLTVFIFSIFGSSAKADVKVGDVYETKSASDLNNKRFMYRSTETIEEDVEMKLNLMEEYKVIIPKTSSNYELALAYSDGNFTFLDTANS